MGCSAYEADWPVYHLGCSLFIFAISNCSPLVRSMALALCTYITNPLYKLCSLRSYLILSLYLKSYLTYFLDTSMLRRYGRYGCRLSMVCFITSATINCIHYAAGATVFCLLLFTVGLICVVTMERLAVDVVHPSHWRRGHFSDPFPAREMGLTKMVDSPERS